MKFINTTRAFFIAIGVLLFGFIWATRYPHAPYEYLVLGITGLFGVTVAKRGYQKKLEVENEKELD